MRWVGLANYQRLAEDPLFLQTLYNTAYITFIGVPVHVLAAFAMALLLNSGVRGLGFYRTVFYLPSVTPVIATLAALDLVPEPLARPDQPGARARSASRGRTGCRASSGRSPRSSWSRPGASGPA